MGLLYHATWASRREAIQTHGLEGRSDVTYSREIAAGFAAAFAEKRGDDHGLLVAINPTRDNFMAAAQTCPHCGGHCPVTGPVNATQISIDLVPACPGAWRRLEAFWNTYNDHALRPRTAWAALTTWQALS